MSKLRAVRNYLWALDPGYFNLKQAYLTVLAIVISLAVVHDSPLLTKLMAGVASGFSVESVIARTWVMRLLRIIKYNVAYFSSFALGLLVRDSANYTALALVSMGFLVNYIRRFGMADSMVPMKAWIMCFLATILPFAHAGEAWTHIHGLLVGLVVSSCIIFSFPENHARLFLNNSNRFFRVLAQGIREVRRYVLLPEPNVCFDELHFVHLKSILVRVIDSNEMMQQSKVFASNKAQIDSILLHQYALANAYSLMLDAYHTLWHNHHQISRPSQRVLSQISRQFMHIFANLTVNSDYTIHLHSVSRYSPNFAKIIGEKTPLSDPMLVMVLLNLKLSFDLFNQNVSTLLRNSDAA